MIANTEWYRIFLRSAEYSNLTKAAHSLHITQPSASYAIKQLEEALGVELFDRFSKGVRLTEEGKLLYQHVKTAFEELKLGEHRIKNLKQLAEGRLRIGANGAIIKDFIVPLLDQFQVSYPKIRIQLSQDKTNLILDRLRHGALDFGYIYLPVSDENVEIIKTHTSPICVVVGSSFANLVNEPLSAKRLKALPLLMLSTGSSTRSFIENWFEAQEVKAEADFELNSLEMLTEFAERGYGAAFLPRAFVESRIRGGSLYELHTEVPLPHRHIGIAVRKNSNLSLAARAFIEMLPQIQ